MESTHSTKSNETAIHITESKSAKAKSAAPPPVAISATTKAASHQQGGWKRGVVIFDFILRLCALIAALTATITMGTTDQTLPFFTQFFQFQASYDDIPTFTYASFICISITCKIFLLFISHITSNYTLCHCINLSKL